MLVGEKVLDDLALNDAFWEACSIIIWKASCWHCGWVCAVRLQNGFAACGMCSLSSRAVL